MAVTAQKITDWFGRSMTSGVAERYAHGAEKIRVNAIVPGWVMTERQLAERATPENLARALEQQALKIRIEPADIAALALFLASEAARAITGQSLVVDAGGPGT